MVGQSADYVLALKGNQGTLHDDVRLFLEDPATPVAEATQVNKGHGRVETRTASVSADVAWLQEIHHWPGLQAVTLPTACRFRDGRTSLETRYYLLSQPFAPERFNDIVRSHWGIENELHWRLDWYSTRTRLGPEGPLCGQPGLATENGPELGPPGTQQGINAGQAETGRLGQQFPARHTRPIRQSTHAIALGLRGLYAVPRLN